MFLSALVLLSPLASRCGRNESRAESEPPPIEIKATVHPAQSMTITAQIDGQVSAVAVREGATVASQAPIAQLTNPGVERDAASARAQLAWIDARLKRGRTGQPAPVRSRDSLELTARILDLKRSRFEKMKQLRKTNDITARELEQAEVEYLAAQREYNQERRVSIGAPASGDDRQLLAIERQKAAADEKFAEQRQSLLNITSPIAGTVTRVHVLPGQAVFPRDPIADVADLATMHVRGTVAPELLRYVKKGMRVDVKIYSVPPRTFADEIEYIIPVQGTDSESRAATIVVTIPNPDGSVQPNTAALITLRSTR